MHIEWQYYGIALFAGIPIVAGVWWWLRSRGVSKNTFRWLLSAAFAIVLAPGGVPFHGSMAVGPAISILVLLLTSLPLAPEAIGFVGLLAFLPLVATMLLVRGGWQVIAPSSGAHPGDPSQARADGPTDAAKRQALVTELRSRPEPLLVPIARYFDGNHDEASMGANLTRPPGIAAFRSILTDLARRPDVSAVYVQISEIDPGEGLWPYTDTVLVFGTIPVVELRQAMAALQPTDVGPASQFEVDSTIPPLHPQPLLLAWWD